MPPLPTHPPHTRGLITLSIALTVTVMLPASAQATPIETAVSRCRAHSDEQQRLSCYDAITVTDTTAADRWSGRNGTDSFEFQASAGMRLLIDHDDAILVGALKDSDGNLLQNLHLAGRGSLRVTIPDDGDFTVTLSATGNWQARLAGSE